jgi:hypothetical protein
MGYSESKQKIFLYKTVPYDLLFLCNQTPLAPRITGSEKL